MIDLLAEGIAAFLVCASFFLLGDPISRSRVLAGWWTVLAACLVWFFIALEAELYFLLAQQIVIAIFAVRGLDKNYG